MGNCLMSSKSHGAAEKSVSNIYSNQSTNPDTTRPSTYTTTSAKSEPVFAAASCGTGTSSMGEIFATPNLKVYTFADMKSATKSFKSDTVLGVGGFGTVYKGWVDENTLEPCKVGSGIMVAVKKLNHESVQGFQEWQELFVIPTWSSYGEDQELVLVYEFMQKGSLENHLFRRSSATEILSCDKRLKIAIGAARGLEFLHSSEKKIIYRDFKASNILLDMDYNPKISDFGLAKSGPSGGDSHVTTRIMGTYGYAAPEYVATGHLYVKSNVYGFGVVLLEMLTGLRVVDMKRPSSQHNLIDWAKPRLLHKRKLKTMMDARIQGQYSTKAAVQAAQLTLQCLAIEPRNRPSMKEVVEVLEQVNSMTVRQ
ncbi:hypothetical protein DCAR_0311425 [Daucus carota subsp. sativus]|uniref:Protein kinase domain-containing protein n=1 Tax=Daucus carota subsp. sativus TaxID=79200 RepID=A0AAF0WLH7_DAUCS|nr:hypothetical protein DCAR_0311425 [Daucus carota subsp. sativus]